METQVDDNNFRTLAYIAQRAKNIDNHNLNNHLKYYNYATDKEYKYITLSFLNIFLGKEYLFCFCISMHYSILRYVSSKNLQYTLYYQLAQTVREYKY